MSNPKYRTPIPEEKEEPKDAASVAKEMIAEHVATGGVVIEQSPVGRLRKTTLFGRKFFRRNK